MAPFGPVHCPLEFFLFFVDLKDPAHVLPLTKFTTFGYQRFLYFAIVIPPCGNMPVLNNQLPLKDLLLSDRFAQWQLVLMNPSKLLPDEVVTLLWIKFVWKLSKSFLEAKNLKVIWLTIVWTLAAGVVLEMRLYGRRNTNCERVKQVIFSSLKFRTSLEHCRRHFSYETRIWWLIGKLWKIGWEKCLKGCGWVSAPRAALKPNKSML